MRPSVGDVLNSTKKLPAAGTKRKKVRKATVPRIWCPDGEYSLVRAGITLKEQPDLILDKLAERTLFIFRHNHDDVEFGANPDVPLWVGVFKMAPRLGYKEDQYYMPTQKHYKVIYQSRPLKQTPVLRKECARLDGSTFIKEESTNDIIQRSGKTFPYWVDAWYHMKQRQKRAKRRHTVNNGSADGVTERLLAGAKMRSTSAIRNSLSGQTPNSGQQQQQQHSKSRQDDADNDDDDGARETVVEVDGVILLPLGGWMADNAKKRKGRAKAIIPSTMLRVSPANDLARDFPSYIQRLGTYTFPAPAPKHQRAAEEGDPRTRGPSGGEAPPYGGAGGPFGAVDPENQRSLPKGPAVRGRSSSVHWPEDMGADPLEEAEHQRLRRKRDPPSEKDREDVDNKLLHLGRLAKKRRERHHINNQSPNPDVPASPVDPGIPQQRSHPQPAQQRSALMRYVTDQHTRCAEGNLQGVQMAYYEYFSQNGGTTANPAQFFVVTPAGKALIDFYQFMHKE